MVAARTSSALCRPQRKAEKGGSLRMELHTHTSAGAHYGVLGSHGRHRDNLAE
jgi:hypothetical protein